MWNATDINPPAHTDSPKHTTHDIPFSSPASPTQNTIPRRSTRQHKPPAYLSDFICNLVSFDALPNVSQVFLAKQSQWHELKTYKDAASDLVWQTTMDKELQALYTNNTWDLVPLPPGKKPIGSKWVYKVKLRSDGSLERHKARLVAKVYHQKHGFYFQETFSPVVRLTTVWCLIALAIGCNWSLCQLDVNNSFLHGNLHEDVYMTAPEGMNCPPHMVCKLKKSLYGLKQSSRQWFSKLTIELSHQGYTQSKNDYSVFTKQTKTSSLFLLFTLTILSLLGTKFLWCSPQKLITYLASRISAN